MFHMLLMLLVLNISVSFAVKQSCHKPPPTDCTEWDYIKHSQTYWEDVSQCTNTKCANTNGQQSPINIDTKQVSACTSTALQMTQLNTATKFHVKNDAGHFNLHVTPDESK
eukprot:222157_1